MVFILVFEFRRCFRLFCMQKCFPSCELTLMVQKVKKAVGLLRNLKKMGLTSNYMSVNTNNGVTILFYPSRTSFPITSTSCSRLKRKKSDQITLVNQPKKKIKASLKTQKKNKNHFTPIIKLARAR